MWTFNNGFTTWDMSYCEGLKGHEQTCHKKQSSYNKNLIK